MNVLELTQGEDMAQPFRMLDSNLATVSLDTLVSAEGRITLPTGTVTLPATIDVGASMVTVTAAAAATAEWPVGVVPFQLWLTWPDRVEELFDGVLQIQAGIS